MECRSILKKMKDVSSIPIRRWKSLALNCTDIGTRQERHTLMNLRAKSKESVVSTIVALKARMAYIDDCAD